MCMHYMPCNCKKGFNSLVDAEDAEEDLLDKAWGLEQNSG